jgi:hypothetical protein
MASDVIDRYRRSFDDKQDAHEKVLASFDSVPTHRQDTPDLRKAVALFAHMVTIEQRETRRPSNSCRSSTTSVRAPTIERIR